MALLWLLGLVLVRATVDFHAVLKKEGELLKQAQTLVDAVQSMRDLAAKRSQDSLLTQVLQLKADVDQLEVLLDVADKALTNKRASPPLSYDAGEQLAQSLSELTENLQLLTTKIKAFDDASLAAKLSEVRRAQDESKVSLQKSVEEIQERKEKLETLVNSDLRVYGLYFILGIVCAILLQTWYTFWKASKTKLP